MPEYIHSLYELTPKATLFTKEGNANFDNIKSYCKMKFIYITNVVFIKINIFEIVHNLSKCISCF